MGGMVGAENWGGLGYFMFHQTDRQALFGAFAYKQNPHSFLSNAPCPVVGRFRQ